MVRTISIREYDKLHIRPERDLDRNIISVSDATHLQSVVIDNSPVFAFGNRCLVAQQYVGVIEMPEFSIEILPKIYGEVDNDKLRDVLIRMLMVANQTNAIKQFKASVAVRKNSFVEMIILSFLRELQIYVDAGLQHEYKKLSQNIGKVKGRILFSQQLRRNVLAPTKFYCRYSKYVADNELNRFFKVCLVEMGKASRDVQNKHAISDLLLQFEAIADAEVDTALSYGIEFNSVNARAREAYVFGRMFLENLHATMSAGTTQMYTMLFNMDQLYELFVYRVASAVFGSKVTYQKMGSYMVSRIADGKKYISLRPDLTIKHSASEQWILDTKWKMPGRFAKESDIYQMNAYSSSIRNVSKVVLLYPRVSRTDQMVGEYEFLDSAGSRRPLEIRTIDLLGCLSWGQFLKSFKDTYSP